MKKRLVFLAVFFVFLLYFVWNSSWHLPSQLIIKGQVELPAEVRVSWDSGAGFNDMETADLVFGNPVETTVRSGAVRIRRIVKGHPAAKSADVWIKAVKRSEDDNLMDLGRFES
jgi:glutaminase